MAELVREMSFSRLATARRPSIRVVGSGIVSKYFGEGNGTVDLITFGVERLNNPVKGEPDGSFCLLDAPDRNLGPLFYNPHGDINGDLPFDRSTANGSLRDILEGLTALGVPVIQVSPIESLGLGAGRSRQTRLAFLSFQSQAKQHFERQTGIPESVAFRVEDEVSLEDRDRILDVGPLRTGDFDVLRKGWDRAGIVQETAPQAQIYASEAVQHTEMVTRLSLLR